MPIPEFLKDGAVPLCLETVTEKTVQDIPELVDLGLFVIHVDGGFSLASLKHRVVLADADKLAYDKSIPLVSLTCDVEEAITKEFFGSDAEYDGSFPGFEAVFTYLSNHPELLEVDK